MCYSPFLLFIIVQCGSNILEVAAGLGTQGNKDMLLLSLVRAFFSNIFSGPTNILKWLGVLYRNLNKNSGCCLLFSVCKKNKRSNCLCSKSAGLKGLMQQTDLKESFPLVKYAAVVTAVFPESSYLLH